MTELPYSFEGSLQHACLHLKILDPEHGDTELIESVASEFGLSLAELANLRERAGGV